jgi:hypothetical protein
MIISKRRGRVCLALMLVLAGCGMSLGDSSAAAVASACVRAADHGAIPNDGIDDRDQLQAAINTAQAGPRCLELGTGRFHATRRPGGTEGIGSLKITGPLSVRGDGEGVTVLAMLGSGTCSGCPGPKNWNLLEITGATDVSVSGLTLDGSQRSQTGEQTHLLQLTGPTQHVVIEHVTFNLPIIAGMQGGDCIRLLGKRTALVRDTTVRDTLGVFCDRSFVSLQRGLDGLVIERSESVRVGDQAIDFEPTGGVNCETILRNVLMRQLTLRKADTTGATVTIAGGNCAIVDSVTLTDSVVEDGNVFILNAHNVTLSQLHLRSVPGSPQVPVLARERIVNLRILDSVIERGADSGPGPAIQIAGADTFRPTDALLSGVRVVSQTPEPLIQTKNLARLVIDDADLIYQGPPVDNAAVHVSADPATPAESPRLEDTTVCGPLASVITTSRNVGEPVLVNVTGPLPSCP